MAKKTAVKESQFIIEEDGPNSFGRKVSVKKSDDDTYGEYVGPLGG